MGHTGGLIADGIITGFAGPAGAGAHAVSYNAIVVVMEAAMFGGLFHFRPSEQFLIVALRSITLLMTRLD